MLIKTIKEIQEENNSNAEADTDTWSPVGRNQENRILKDAERPVEV